MDCEQVMSGNTGNTSHTGHTGVKVVSRRREQVRVSENHNMEDTIKMVGDSLKTACVCSLRPTAEKTLSSFVEAWQHEYRILDRVAGARAVQLLCGDGPGTEPPS